MTDSTRTWNGTRKTPKFRASCDSCNEAKVRCSQTRPSCARCNKNRVHCVYGLSQRYGKHSAESYASRNATIGPPPTPTSPSTVEMETPRSSNTRQLQNEAFDPNFLPHEIPNFPETPGNLNFPSIDMLGMQRQQRRSSCQYGEDGMQSIRPGSIHGYCPISTLDLQSLESPGILDASLVHCDQEEKSDRLSHNSSNTSCVSRASNRLKDHTFATLGTCRCCEGIVVQLSSLPALLQNERYDFDVELVQFQEAIRLCTSVLACNCAGKDYSSVLATSLLISRVLCVVERGIGGVSTEESGLPPDIFGDASAISSPKISLGMYNIDEEDERKLRQEMWWLQFKKVELLVAGFKEVVTKVRQHQEYQDVVQAAAWEKLHFLLDHKAQVVKREWIANRGKN